jgi:amidase
MYAIAGMRTGGGNPDWLSSQMPAKNHAALVQRLLDEGATITGNTICDEFFFSIMGANAHYGTPHNPKAPGRLPGGSSSGSASAVASGACDLALGSDTGGSVRVPASFCGVYGIRPTLGRVDGEGMMPMSQTFDTPGWFASSPGVFGKARILLDGQHVAADPKQVLVAEDAFAQADPEIAAFLRAALDVMSADLPPLQSAQVSSEGFDSWREIFRTIQGYEVWQNYGEFVRTRKPRLGPGVRERLEYASQIAADEYNSARQKRVLIQSDLEKKVGIGALLALPTTPCVAPPADLAGETADAFRARVMRLTCIAGIGGLPQVSLPVGTACGFPVGLSFIGWKGGDEALLDLAQRLARYFGMAA